MEQSLTQHSECSFPVQGRLVIGSLAPIPFDHVFPADFYAVDPIWAPSLASPTSNALGRVCNARPTFIRFRLAGMQCATATATTAISRNQSDSVTYRVKALEGTTSVVTGSLPLGQRVKSLRFPPSFSLSVYRFLLIYSHFIPLSVFFVCSTLRDIKE